MDELIHALEAQGIITVKDIERMTTLELLLMMVLLPSVVMTSYGV